jgi:hypothetical protein
VLGTVAEDYEPDLNSIKVAQPVGGGNAVFSNVFPVQAHGDPPGLRVFGSRTWKLFREMVPTQSEAVFP